MFFVVLSIPFPFFTIFRVVLEITVFLFLANCLNRKYCVFKNGSSLKKIDSISNAVIWILKKKTLTKGYGRIKSLVSQNGNLSVLETGYNCSTIVVHVLKALSVFGFLKISNGSCLFTVFVFGYFQIPT